MESVTHERKASQAENNDLELNCREGAISLESLLTAYEGVLSEKEVGKICSSCSMRGGDLEQIMRNIHETLVETAILKSMEHCDDLPEDQGVIGWGKSDFEAMYFETLSREELDQIWEECASISRTTSISSEDIAECKIETFSG